MIKSEHCNIFSSACLKRRFFIYINSKQLKKKRQNSGLLILFRDNTLTDSLFKILQAKEEAGVFNNCN